MPHTPHAEPTEFKNDQVHVVVLQKSACRVELRVKATHPLIQAARREAVKAVGKEVLIPGFRKGRAPDDMILKKYPKEVEKETHNKLADASFAEAQKLAKVPLLNNNARVTFDLQKMDSREAELVFTFETEPAIPAIDPKQFELKPVERAQIGEKEINEAIRQMQFFFRSMEACHGPARPRKRLHHDRPRYVRRGGSPAGIQPGPIRDFQ